MVYNFIRFHSPLEQGYSYQVIPHQTALARSYGLFSLVHLPGNLYYALLSMPLPVFRDGISHVLEFPYFQNNPWGMSIFITSPYLIWLFTIKTTMLDKSTRNMLIAVVVSAFIIFTYYGVGFYQFGYRYALDFLPLLFVLFMIKYRERHKKLTSQMKFVLLGSGVLNFYLVLTFLKGSHF